MLKTLDLVLPNMEMWDGFNFRDSCLATLISFYSSLRLLLSMCFVLKRYTLYSMTPLFGSAFLIHSDSFCWHSSIAYSLMSMIFYRFLNPSVNRSS